MPEMPEMPEMLHMSQPFRGRQRWWPFNIRLLAAWQMRRAAPVAGILLAIGALLASAIPGPTGVQAASTGAPASGAGRILIRQADLHVDTVAGDDELEVDLSISQTQDACQTPLNGQVCLRYTILVDDRAVQSGYGLISEDDVEIAASAIRLQIDTRHEPRIIRTAGTGGPIALTWSTAATLPRPTRGASVLTAATVQGSIVGYAIPRTNVTAGVLLYGSP